MIHNRKSIDERPAIVEQRQHLGDWEGDLIIGKKHQGAVLTLVERKSRFTLIRKVEGKQALPVANAMIECLSWVPAVETITNDNGKEFASHKMVSTAFVNSRVMFTTHSRVMFTRHSLPDNFHLRLSKAHFLPQRSQSITKEVHLRFPLCTFVSFVVNALNFVR